MPGQIVKQNSSKDRDHQSENWKKILEQGSGKPLPCR